MGCLGDVTVVPELVEILSDEHAEYKYGASWREISHIVGSLGDITIIPVLEKALEGKLKAGTRWSMQYEAIRKVLEMIQQRIDEEKQRDVLDL